MKKIFAAALVLVALASCKKDPTLADRLEGTWLVDDIIASGQVSIDSISIPLVANDIEISPTSIFTLVQDPNSVSYSVDALLGLSLGQSLEIPWTQSGSGTWIAIDGGGATPDSVHIIGSNGTTSKYEVLSLLNSSVRLKTRQVMEFQGEGVDLIIEFGFVKQ